MKPTMSPDARRWALVASALPHPAQPRRPRTAPPSRGKNEANDQYPSRTKQRCDLRRISACEVQVFRSQKRAL